jgi:titin
MAAYTSANAPLEYDIEMLNNAGTFSVLKTISNAATTSDTITVDLAAAQLTNGNSYVFYIWPKNGSGRSATPLLLTGTPVGPASAPIVNLAVGPKQISVNWSQPANNGGRVITNYRISAVQNSAPPVNVDVSACNPLTMACILTKLQDGSDLLNDVSVTVTVEAYNGEWGTAATATGTPSALPSAVTGLSGLSTATRSITLSWTSTETRFRIERSSTGAVWNSLTPNDDGVNPYVDTTIAIDGVDLFYRVSAINDAGVGPATVITAQSKGPSSAVQNLAATSDNNSVLLSWDLPANTGGLSLSGYQITGSSYDGTVWTALTDTYLVCGANTTSFQWLNLTNGTPYRFTVSPFAVIPGHPAFVCGTSVVSNADYYIGTASTSPSATPTAIPGVVSGLLATAGDGQVTLTWDPLPGANRYVVEAKGATGPNFANVTCVDDTLPTCLVTGLIPGLTYIFRVTALNNAGAGTPVISTVSLQAYVAPPTPPSNGGGSGSGSGGGTQIVYVPAPGGGTPVITPVPTPVPVAPVAAPTNVKIAVGDRNVNVVWTPVKAAKGYRVATSQDGTTYNTISTLPEGSSQTSIKNLINGETIYIRITPFDGDVDGTPAVVAAVPATVPNQPAKVLITPHDESIDIAWLQPTENGGQPVTGYLVEYSTDSAATWQTYREVTSLVTNLVFNNVSNGVTYLVRVSAINKMGRGQARTAQTTTTAGTTNSAATIAVVPMSPVQASITSTGDRTMRVSWNKPNENGGAKITEYLIEKSVDGEKFDKVSVVSAASTNVAVNGLTNGVTYFIRISALTSAGVGAATVVSGTPAAAPSATTVAPKQVLSNDGRAIITWNEPANTGGLAIKSYRVEKASSLKGPWTVSIPSTGSGLTRVVVPGIKSGETTYIRVRGITDAGIGAPSPAVAVTPVTPASAPLKPVIAKKGKILTLSFKAPRANGGSEITSYVIQVSVDGRTWKDFDTSKGTKYVFGNYGKAILTRVRAVTAAGAGTPSAAVSLK